MRFAMELCDEIPMLLLVLAFLVGKEDCIGFMSDPQASVASASCAGPDRVSVVSYIALFVYEIFVYSFGLAVLFEIGLGLSCRPKTWQTRACSLRAVVGAVWQLEQNLCTRNPHMWPLHVVCTVSVRRLRHRANVFLRKEKLRCQSA